uniref:Cilia and flagella associated protein 99 n=1 Tax=Neogobius melanostomus TaxID=47308 RepID=A0A8C6WKR5_9GOBI
MPSKYVPLVKEAIRLLDRFCTDRQCLDDFVETISKEPTNLDPQQRSFILDTISGCIEYKQLLDVVVNLFYKIPCFTIHLFPFSPLEFMTKRDTCFDNAIPHSVVHFESDLICSGLFNKKYSCMSDSLSYCVFVMTNSLARWRTEIVALLEELSVQVSRGSQLKKAPARTTVPQEFALTKAKPRAVLLPEIIPELEKPQPVSLICFFLICSIICSHASSLFQSSWDIKLNSATILRQGALVDRQLKQELLRMERLMEGTQEPSAFLQWQKEMRERDLREELAKVECRRLEGRISHEEAAMARSRLMAQNHTAALLKREEMAELMRRYAEKRLHEEKEMRELVQQVSDGHKNAKAAKEKLYTMKQKIVQEVSKESQELLRRALAEAQAELIRKFEIIQQIRAIESNSLTRGHFFDDTKPGGHDLLGEMSLCELRERLALLKEAQLKEEQQRRQYIHEQRHQRKLLLQNKLDNFHLHHTALKQATTLRSPLTGRISEKITLCVDETILALQKKLEEKKQERDSLRHRNSSRPAHMEGTHSSVSI